MAARTKKKKAIALALQGGGAHGAFTWGVLDRLLDDDRLEISAISGTSAGAMNAVVLADGFEKGGVEGAKEALANFWAAMSDAGAFSPYRSGPFNPLGPSRSPLALWFDWLGQMFSPYQLNPLNINPLRDVLSDTIDFACVQNCQKLKLFVSATNVCTNELRIFTNGELSVDTLMASACLPQISQAVEIDGDYYWDGGYMGNPVLEPLIDECEDFADIFVIQINPTHCDGAPRTALDIANRVNEISFNASLMREVRAIAGVTRLIDAGIVKDPRYRCVYFHRIAAEEALNGLGVRSKFDTNPSFLRNLHDQGYERGGHWLDGHFEDLGLRSTFDLTSWNRPKTASA